MYIFEITDHMYQDMVSDIRQKTARDGDFYGYIKIGNLSFDIVHQFSGDVPSSPNLCCYALGVDKGYATTPSGIPYCEMGFVKAPDPVASKEKWMASCEDTLSDFILKHEESALLQDLASAPLGDWN